MYATQSIPIVTRLLGNPLESCNLPDTSYLSWGVATCFSSRASTLAFSCLCSNYPFEVSSIIARRALRNLCSEATHLTLQVISSYSELSIEHPRSHRSFNYLLSLRLPMIPYKQNVGSFFRLLDRFIFINH